MGSPCAGMLIVDNTMLREAGSGLFGVGDESYSITGPDGNVYTFGDSDYNIFTGQVTDMNYLFLSTSFDEDIGYWDTSNVTSMFDMFRSATIFNQDIGSWDVSSVIDMRNMFNGANNFNQDIGGWDVSNVILIEGMFRNTLNFNNGGSPSINNWNLSSTTVLARMFQDADSFNQPIGGWDVGHVISFQNMFNGANSFSQPLNDWNVINALDMDSMFRNTVSFNEDLSCWNVVQIESPPSNFNSDSNLQEIHVPSWGTTGCWTFELAEFQGCYNSQSISSIGEEGTECEGLLIVDRELLIIALRQNINVEGSLYNASLPNGVFTGQITDMSGRRINYGLIPGAFNEDIGYWDVSGVTNMQSMFSGANSFNQDIGGWDVSSVTNMQSMFQNAASFNQNLNSWSVSQVTICDSFALDSPIYLTANEPNFTSCSSEDTSCPFIYSFNGEEFVLEHEAFPFSVIKNTQSTSFDRLAHLESVNSSYILQIREELDEISYINSFRLIEVYHEKDGIVMPSTDGNIHILSNLMSPSKCTLNKNNCLDEISKRDSIFSFSIQEDFFSQKVYKDEWLVSFELPKLIDSKGSTGRLKLSIEEQFIITEYWEKYINKIGKNHWNLWQNILSFPLFRLFLGEDSFKEVIGLKIEVLTTEGWEVLDYLAAGMHMTNDFLVEFDMNTISSNEEVVFRISSPKGFFRVDSIHLDIEENGDFYYLEKFPMNMSYLVNSDMELSISDDEVESRFYNNNRLISKDNNNLKDVISNQIFAIENRYLVLEKGDIVELRYSDIEINKPDEDWFTSHVIEINGYYNFVNFEENRFRDFLRGVWTSIRIVFALNTNSGDEMLLIMGEDS